MTNNDMRQECTYER